MEHARGAELQQIYVHVLHSNAAARQLYVQRCGFAVEQEESEAVAVGLRRPSRMLLRLDCGAMNGLPI